MEERNGALPWYKQPTGYYPRVMCADPLTRLLLAEIPALVIRADEWWYWVDGPHTDAAHRKGGCAFTEPVWWDQRPGAARAVRIEDDEVPAGYVLCHFCVMSLITSLRLDVPIRRSA